jgi:hypothetical protein
MGFTTMEARVISPRVHIRVQTIGWMWYSLTKPKISSNSNGDSDYRSAQPNVDRINKTTLLIRLTKRGIFARGIREKCLYVTAGPRTGFHRKMVVSARRIKRAFAINAAQIPESHDNCKIWNPCSSKFAQYDSEANRRHAPQDVLRVSQSLTFRRIGDVRVLKYAWKVTLGHRPLKKS